MSEPPKLTETQQKGFNRVREILQDFRTGALDETVDMVTFDAAAVRHDLAVVADDSLIALVGLVTGEFNRRHGGTVKHSVIATIQRSAEAALRFKFWVCEKCKAGIREDVETATHLMVAEDGTHKRCGGTMTLHGDEVIDREGVAAGRVRLLEERLRQGANVLRSLDTGTTPEMSMNLRALATAFEVLADLSNLDPSVTMPPCAKTNKPVDVNALMAQVPKPCDCPVCSAFREGYIGGHLWHGGSVDG